MDRFIVTLKKGDYIVKGDLKSSMDRFIGPTATGNCSAVSYLKSSMDRFIEVFKCRNNNIQKIFKIQYG